jgi:hypothetical protein
MKNSNLTSKTVFTLFSALMFSMAGCASGPPINLYVAPNTALAVPAVNTQASADVGQTIISKASVTKIPAIKLANPVSENINLTSTTSIQVGPHPLHATSDAGKYYRDFSTPYGGIYVPNDKSQPAVIYHAPLAGNYGKVPVKGIEPTEIEQWARDSFKRELIYAGVSQTTISISYREFSDNVARPAFSQELKYDLNQGSTIGYKGARFEVIKATNTELIYKVIKPLD